MASEDEQLASFVAGVELKKEKVISGLIGESNFLWRKDFMPNRLS